MASSPRIRSCGCISVQQAFQAGRMRGLECSQWRPVTSNQAARRLLKTHCHVVRDGTPPPFCPTHGTFTFTHPQGALAGDLAAAYQWSKDLQTYHGDLTNNAAGTTVGFTVQANTPVPGITTVTTTVSGTPCDRLFLRAKVMEK